LSSTEKSHSPIREVYYINIGVGHNVFYIYRHVAIKNNMVDIYHELVGFHHYCSCHFINNFNTRFKYSTLKKKL
jgi:hypothetical protein